MTTSIDYFEAAKDYFEAAKIQELTSQLRDEGYRITIHPGGEDEGYDLVAEKGNRKVAVEVKFNARLRESAETIKALRRRAIERGYHEFRLVVVSPPHETKVDIEGLEKKLLAYLRQEFPDALKNIPQIPRIENVSDLDIDSISITADGTRVTGNGVVRVGGPLPHLEPIDGIVPCFVRDLYNFPFSFEIRLDSELNITGENKIDIDTSSWFDED